MQLPWHYIDLVKYGVFGLFVLTAVIQLFYYFYYYLRPISYKRAPQLKTYPISVVICARNEAHNLRSNLEAVLKQQHDNYEVIVVNDCSTDDTDDVLGEYMKKYKHLKVTSIVPDQKFTHGKKLAITVGIKAAKNDWLVFTDADCEPVSDQWLNRIQENFSTDTSIVLGYGGYKAKKGMLNAYIRFDTLFIAMHYFGFALAKTPYMGVGRNLAYRKELFFKNKGFAKHYNLLSGDDDLFVNETATSINTAVEFHPESHTLSEPETRWKDFFNQKKRHFTTAKRYKASHIFKLGLEPLTRFLYYFCIGYLLALNIQMIPVAAIMAGRLIARLIIVKANMKRLSVSGILFWVIVFDVLSLFINFSIYLSSIFSRQKKRWK